MRHSTHEKMTRYLLFILLPISSWAQIPVNYSINTTADTHAISPYIYGMCNGGYDEATIRRVGGNRMTGYNWENNASNAGSDWFHQNDDYLPWSAGIPAANYNDPGIFITDFHDKSLLHNAESAVTLQMAGYVARDKNGTTVEASEAAPSNRWVEIVNHKPSAFSLVPDLNDNYIYTDEWLNFLIQEYGNASSANGIKAFILDNEPGLWTSTHPRLYTGQLSCVDHLNKSIALAKTIREMDPGAEIWGPEAYGYSEYRTFQDASDWNNYSGQYSHYLAAYLDSMQQASTASGSRLLNVLTVHWYPDVYAGSIYSSDVSPNIARERMQVPRSLWDSTYIENGWIGQWFSQDLPIVPKLQSLISNYYPGTKLGITEYDYGGDAHISGGIAEVEALSAFARTGIQYATKWGGFSDYSLSGVRLFREVNNPFGDTYVRSNSSDRTHSGIVASIDANDDSKLHLIVTNKDEDSTILAHFAIASGTVYDSIDVYFFDQNSPTIQTLALSPSILQSGGFDYLLQPLTAYHFVLKNVELTNSLEESAWVPEITCFPNPVDDQLQVMWERSFLGTLSLLNVMGQEIHVAEIDETQNMFTFTTSNLLPGTYFISAKNKSGVYQKRVVKI